MKAAYQFISYDPGKGFSEAFCPTLEAAKVHYGPPLAFTSRKTHKRLRDELIGEPMFIGWNGPMWGGWNGADGSYIVRYESPEACKELSK